MSLALNFERKCRTCGTDILELTCGIPIFGSGLQLDHKIHRYLGLDVSLHDDLPKCLCATCFIKIESIDKFAILAKKTEEAYLGWFKCIRANIAKHYSPIPGPSTTVGIAQTPIMSPGVIPQKIDFNALKLAVDDQMASSSQRVSPSTDVQVVKLIKPEIPIVSYSDLKLGLLIKDQELLKLILKALKWADHDPRASFEVLIQRLKNTTFREVLSNHNLLNDSDLIQLLQSYIGQEAFLKFSGGSGAGGMNLGARAVTIKPAVLPVPVRGNNHSPAPSSTVVKTTNDVRIEEDSVTQMEVGVDPSLFLDDEDSQNKTRIDKPKKPENVVTIKLVPANLTNKSPAEKMIPAILKCDVRNNGRHACTTCPESFPTKTDLQQHIVTAHLVKTQKPTSAIKIDTKAIKIRVKKAKTQVQDEPPKTPPVKPIIPASIPICIPPTTTITVVPAVTKPVESTVQPVTSNTNTATSTTTSALQKPTEPPKVSTKSKRKREIKRPLKIRLLPPKRTRGKTVTVASSSKLNCSTCKKSFSSKGALKAHVETHKVKETKPDKPQQYTCEKCNQNFKTSSSLAKHKQSHVGDKPDRARRGNSSSSAGSTLKTRTSRTVTPGRASVRAGTKRGGGSRN
uniref:Zinc finger protein 354C n=1 Tax=Culex pipiens TaxID=7175 RepID=A0A8D8IM44_CULPI